MKITKEIIETSATNEKEFDILEKTVKAKLERIESIYAGTEDTFIMTKLLGVDHFNREFWGFNNDTSKIFVQHNGNWNIYYNEETINKLTHSFLNKKGIKEKELFKQLTSYYLPGSFMSKVEALSKLKEYSHWQRNSSLQTLKSSILSIEQAYNQYFPIVEWESKKNRDIWREMPEQLNTLNDVTLWFLEFVAASNAPYKLASSIPRHFRPKDCDNFKLDDIIGHPIDSRSDDRSTFSLTPLIWRIQGYNICKSWVSVILQAKGLTEMEICVAFFARLLNNANAYISDIEKQMSSKCNYTPVQMSSESQYKKEIAIDSIKLLRNTKKIVVQDDRESRCLMCGDRGDLIKCRTCSNVAHKGCVYVDIVASLTWQCERCGLKIVMGQSKNLQGKLKPC